MLAWECRRYLGKYTVQTDANIQINYKTKIASTIETLTENNRLKIKCTTIISGYERQLTDNVNHNNRNVILNIINYT